MANRFPHFSVSEKMSQLKHIEWFVQGHLASEKELQLEPPFFLDQWFPACEQNPFMEGHEAIVKGLQIHVYIKHYLKTE